VPTSRGDGGDDSRERWPVANRAANILERMRSVALERPYRQDYPPVWLIG
jgi:hypothetical protein